eukprot:365376-Chlamydomonas_euryale.AAC.10
MLHCKCEACEALAGAEAAREDLGAPHLLQATQVWRCGRASVHAGSQMLARWRGWSAMRWTYADRSGGRVCYDTSMAPEPLAPNSAV